MNDRLPQRGALTPFLGTILKSELFTKSELRALLEQAPRDCCMDPALLANHLVQTGRLSCYQARKLLDGTSKGLVLGPYHVLAPIGKGGMSRVYLARDHRGGMLVALKVLPPKKADEERRHRARFLREMELCQRVAHRHLAQTYEIGVNGGVYYIAMEFIPGRSLFRVVSDDGPLQVARAARLFAEVASALDHAHERGLIHRDIKPSNILITPRDQAKVVDFGLAIMEGEMPSDHRVVGGQGYVVGTMDYLAPEQAEDAAKVEPCSDIYSLGCTLYFALTGRPPFPGGTALQKILRHRNEDPVPVTRLNPDVPAGFAALLERMMAKQKEDRFRSARAVRRVLKSWTNHGAPESAPRAVSSGSPRPRRRRADGGEGPSLENPEFRRNRIAGADTSP
jgi:serine/threonine protein kinase